MPPSVVLGVTGSIAAYKAVDILRRMAGRGYGVSVVMTESACRFVSPLTFEVLSRQKVCRSLWDEPLSHIELAGADLILVAPATANIIAKAAAGVADDLLSTLLIAAEAEKTLFAPAMNHRMFGNPIVQGQIDLLAGHGFTFIPPETGDLACGEEGMGRLADLDEIMSYADRTLREHDMRDENVLITSGPTRESLDPVRFISNRSSGKMGAALAREAFNRGANVTIVSGPTNNADAYIPKAIKCVRVETAGQMHRAVMEEAGRATTAVLAAAVSDYAPRISRSLKTPKNSEPEPLELVSTPDILMELGQMERRPFLVGFSAETGPCTDRALEKLRLKNCDLMVFNDVIAAGAGFDVDTNVVSLIDPSGKVNPLPVMSKDAVARSVFDRVLDMKALRGQQ